MQKSIYSFVVLISLILITSCANTSEGEGVRASDPGQEVSRDVTLNSDLQSKVGSWLEKDVECYGIVVGYFADGNTLGKSVKCRVVAIKPEKIKMKTIESVSLLPGEGCDKMGLAYGDTWWEEDGDIFRTREEAEAFIEAKGWSSKK
ncbi:MAG: hypothetical protein R2756_14210 [Bacteroidales bacterium]